MSKRLNPFSLAEWLKGVKHLSANWRGRPWEARGQESGSCSFGPPKEPARLKIRRRLLNHHLEKKKFSFLGKKRKGKKRRQENEPKFHILKGAIFSPSFSLGEGKAWALANRDQKEKDWDTHTHKLQYNRMGQKQRFFTSHSLCHWRIEEWWWRGDDDDSLWRISSFLRVIMEREGEGLFFLFFYSPRQRIRSSWSTASCPRRPLIIIIGHKHQ